jgi:hypothetical protein
MISRKRDWDNVKKSTILNRNQHKEVQMNLRCFYCQTPFTLGMEEKVAALRKMHAENQHHYDARCPRCGRANPISRERLEMFTPGWQEAIKAAPSASMPAEPGMPKPASSAPMMETSRPASSSLMTTPATKPAPMAPAKKAAAPKPKKAVKKAAKPKAKPAAKKKAAAKKPAKPKAKPSKSKATAKKKTAKKRKK